MKIASIGAGNIGATLGRSKKNCGNVKKLAVKET